MAKQPTLANTDTPSAETLFTWQKHALYNYHDGFEKRGGTCTYCGQRFNSQPTAASCPGVKVYSPYAHPGQVDRWPDYLVSAEELAKENLMPNNYHEIRGCLHAHATTIFIALYDRRNAIARPADHQPPAEAIKASCTSVSTQPRAPRKPHVKTAPDLPSVEKATQLQAKREKRGEQLPTEFQEDRQYYALHLGFQKTGLGNKLFWSHHDNYWSLRELLVGVRQGPWGGKDGVRFHVTASYDGEIIGGGTYHKIGERQDLTQVTTEETNGALSGLLEAAIIALLAEEEDEALREAEAQRTVPCAYCRRPVLVRESSPVRKLTIQVDQGEPVSFALHACDSHAKHVRQATLLNVELHELRSLPALGTWTLNIAPVEEVPQQED